ncbi:MAG: ABC transporter permease, partial [Deltaproteobacteria bacterium]|nr:ABC transporter permease [Deltaproteobacteria bacterium]
MSERWLRPGLLIGIALALILILAAVFAPWVAPHDPLQQNLARRLEPPGREYILGTDSMGRCVASRIIYGLRPSLALAVSVTAVVASFGLWLGVAAAYFSVLDAPLMRLTDCFFAFPAIVLSLLSIGILGPGLESLIVALALPGWPKYARVARSKAMDLKRQGHVEATRALGAGPLYILG